jgi:hypothetical protein
MSIKQSLKNALYRVRNPELSEDDAEFNRRLGTRRLLFLVPFLIAAAIVLLFAFK